jgi:hypothetical protein
MSLILIGGVLFRPESLAYATIRDLNGAQQTQIYLGNTSANLTAVPCRAPLEDVQQKIEAWEEQREADRYHDGVYVPQSVINAIPLEIIELLGAEGPFADLEGTVAFGRSVGDQLVALVGGRDVARQLLTTAIARVKDGAKTDAISAAELEALHVSMSA